MTNISSIAGKLISVPAGMQRIRIETQKRLLTTGKQNEPAILYRLPNGKLYVDSGRHRVMAAYELNIPLKVIIRRGAAGAEVGTIPLLSNIPK